VINRLEEREAFIHSEAQLSNTDLVSDSAGKSTHWCGSLNPPTTAKEHEAQNFAKMLARHLKELHNQRHYENLVLIAPPRFLGMLRNELLSPLDKLVTFTIDKDLTTASVESIIGHIKS
jgi:protein required for attachment to host cells